MGGMDDFAITASDIVGQSNGRLFWGLSRNPSGGIFGPSPFGGHLCLLGPQTLGSQNSGGNPGICDGAFSFPVTQSFMSTHGLLAGTTMYFQIFYEDLAHPDGSGVGHTDALQATLKP